MKDGTRTFLALGAGFCLGTHLGMYFLSSCLLVGMVVLIFVETQDKY
jgi:hypothetical protein